MGTREATALGYPFHPAASWAPRTGVDDLVRRLRSAADWPGCPWWWDIHRGDDGENIAKLLREAAEALEAARRGG